MYALHNMHASAFTKEEKVEEEQNERVKRTKRKEEEDFLTDGIIFLFTHI